MTDELVRLSVRRVPIVGLETRTSDSCEIVKFADGTRLVLDVRDGSVSLRRLERLMPTEGVFLEGVRPLIGSFWYRLWFSTPPGSEVLTRVVRVEGSLRDKDSLDRLPPRRSIADPR